MEIACTNSPNPLLNRLVGDSIPRSSGNGASFFAKNSGQGVPEIDTQTSSGATSRILSDAATGQVLGLTDSAGDTAVFVVDGTNNQVAALTDTGAVGFQAAYDPYGTGGVTSGGSSSFWTQNPYGFCAGDRTSTSQGGLVKFGQRWFNTATGNWTQQDTLDAPLDPGNANRYACAGGDPINGQDPNDRIYFTGTQVRDIAQQAVSAAFGLLYGIPIDAGVGAGCAVTIFIGCIGVTVAGAALDNSFANASADVAFGQSANFSTV